jgi:hypothetical protein
MPTPIRAALAAVALAGLIVSLPAAGRAQSPQVEQRTTVTFNEPVEVPHRILPAGTYVFQILEPVSSQNIVQIFDASGKHLIGTVLAIPDYRMRPTGKPVVMFDERPAGGPEAVRGWFFPGYEYGHQFVYPHERAMELSRVNHTHVLSMRDGSSPEQMRGGSINSVGPDGQNGTVNDAVQSQR